MVKVSFTQRNIKFLIKWLRVAKKHAETEKSKNQLESMINALTLVLRP